VREAGARAVHVRISCPPTVSPCYYGVDTPNKEELIAARMSVEEVCRFIEADSLGYLSMEGMLEACGLPADTSCVACWTGRYPTRISPRAETQYAREHEPVPSD
jgi:amidophosphoribosyltransferase